MVTRHKNVAHRVVSLAAFAAMVGANAYSVVIPAFSDETSGIYSVYPILLKPARPTFAILALICLLLALYAVWQLSSPKAPPSLIYRINVRFIVLAAARIAWSIAWRYGSAVLTALFMLVVLISLITIIRLISSEEMTMARREKFFIKLPFFVLYGWVTVTIAANAAALLVSVGVDGFGPVSEELAIVTLAAVTILGMWTGIQLRSTSYLGVFIWTYGGILYRYVWEDGISIFYPRLVKAIKACLVLLFVALAVEIMNKVRKKKET